MSLFTKEDFCKYMPEIVRRHTESEKWVNAIADLFDAEMSTYYENEMLKVLLDILIEKLDDEYGWLEYFFFERKCEWFNYEENGEVFLVDSYEKLYDLITGRK